MGESESARPLFNGRCKEHPARRSLLVRGLRAPRLCGLCWVASPLAHPNLSRPATHATFVVPVLHGRLHARASSSLGEARGQPRRPIARGMRDLSDGRAGFPYAPEARNLTPHRTGLATRAGELEIVRRLSDVCSCPT